MTETPVAFATSPTTDIVRRFYDALIAHDSARTAEIVNENFAEDAEVHFPGSLPHGGSVRGAARLAKMFARAAASEGRAGAVGLRVATIVGDAEHVVAKIEFDWFRQGQDVGIATSALELWTFSGERVVSLHAYYWDAAQLIERVGADR